MQEYGTEGINTQRTALFDPVPSEEAKLSEATAEEESSSGNRKTDKEEAPQRTSRAKTMDREELALFQEKYLKPIRLSHRKAVYVS